MRAMERDLAGVSLSASDYRRLVEACEQDIRFPSTYEEWNALVEAGNRVVLGLDAPPSNIALDVDDFVAWSQRVDVTPCLDGLRAYLILVRRRQHIPGTSPTGPRAKARARHPRDGPNKGAGVAAKSPSRTSSASTLAAVRRPSHWWSWSVA